MGRIRRIRRLASVALAEYAIGDAHLRPLRQAGNTLFRVWSDDLPSAGARADLLEEGQYLLRVDQPGYQETEAIELQLAWLTTMWREADLPVSESVAALDGQGCSRSVMRLCPGQAIALSCGGSKVAQRRTVSGRTISGHKIY